VLGLVHFTGSVLVDEVEATNRREWRTRRGHVAWVPQRPAVGRFPLLVRELLASSGDIAAAAAAADRLGVGGLLDRPLHTLSGGQLQRAFLARGLGHVAAGATLVLADEPTSALDFDTRDLVGEVLAATPVTRLVVTHDRAVTDAADRVLEMAAGRVREVAR
jgi:ABC-type Mn2+/Zn2+ transport system ATPase subunit